MRTCDALVVGGGPAGLAGALYLARFRRHVMVVDGGDSRASRIPRSHNVAGFAAGIGGERLVAIMRQQVADVGVEIVRSQVERIEHVDGGFVAQAGGVPLYAKTVLLATGALDVEPAMPDIAEARDDGALRYCPVCDGYEASGRDVGVLCNSQAGAGEALYLRHFTDRLQVFVTSADVVFDAPTAQRLAAAGIVLHPQPVRRIRLEDGEVVITHGDRTARCESLYSALGMQVHSGLAAALGAEIDADGYVLTDRHQQTRVGGLYSAGDVAKGLNQISVGIGAAAVAASAMHLQLRELT